MPKIQPAVKTINFIISATAPGSTVTSFIDISQCASIVNRRFYRQGLNWVVGGFKLVALPNYLGAVSITKLPDTWAVSNAWHKTYAAWKRQQDETMKDAGALSTIAKYRDFKIHMDPVHVLAGFGANLTPSDAADQPYLLGEWSSPQIVIPNDGGVAGATVEYVMHMVGDDLAVGAGQSKGLIENYANSRAVPFSPDPEHLVPQNTFFNEMHDVGEQLDDIIVNATEQNDDLPYNQDDYPGGATNAPQPQVVDVTNITARTLTDTSTLKGDTFPCGLVRVTTVTDAGSAVAANKLGLMMFLVPGNNRGYMTQDMQDM